jgi:hypothetical protein
VDVGAEPSFPGSGKWIPSANCLPKPRRGPFPALTVGIRCASAAILAGQAHPMGTGSPGSSCALEQQALEHRQSPQRCCRHTRPKPPLHPFDFPSRRRLRSLHGGPSRSSFVRRPQPCGRMSRSLRQHFCQLRNHHPLRLLTKLQRLRGDLPLSCAPYSSRRYRRLRKPRSPPSTVSRRPW